MKKEDADLIQRIISGDEDAFTALVEKHQKWVHFLELEKPISSLMARAICGSRRVLGL